MDLSSAAESTIVVLLIQITIAGLHPMTKHGSRYHPRLRVVLLPVEYQFFQDIRTLRGSVTRLGTVGAKVVQLPGVSSPRRTHPDGLPIAFPDGLVVEKLPAVNIDAPVVHTGLRIVPGAQVCDPGLASRQDDITPAECLAGRGHARKVEDCREDVHHARKSVGDSRGGAVPGRKGHDAGAANAALKNP